MPKYYPQNLSTIYMNFKINLTLLANLLKENQILILMRLHEYSEPEIKFGRITNEDLFHVIAEHYLVVARFYQTPEKLGRE